MRDFLSCCSNQKILRVRSNLMRTSAHRCDLACLKNVYCPPYPTPRRLLSCTEGLPCAELSRALVFCVYS
ncbi:hypothetical protein THI_1655 [Thiomonas arsenitoxydans]|uniref:Uncharacterized protein n=1 Tax=Thiomonas arsenitoxydans (strain DSM 22701 / CIP 110005 / 3As) TaxID=426114 RepID=D6CSR3_THIA3|nr:hypothetical protein THI_1655 [Thiomonas arsenitoxydans]